jgi:hypothetical protein
MKMYGGSVGIAHTFLILELGGGEWSASHPDKRTLVPIGEKAGKATEPVWMLWITEESLFLLGIQPRFPRCPAHSPVTTFTELSWLPLHCKLQTTAEPRLCDLQLSDVLCDLTQPQASLNSELYHVCMTFTFIKV